MTHRLDESIDKAVKSCEDSLKLTQSFRNKRGALFTKDEKGDKGDVQDDLMSENEHYKKATDLFGLNFPKIYISNFKTENRKKYPPDQPGDDFCEKFR